MIKPISTSPIRKAALALLVTAPLIAGGCKSRQQANESNIITESVTLTSEQAEAVKNVALVQIVQDDSNDKPIYSNERNTKLEEKVKILFKELDIEDTSIINDFNSSVGTFSASVLMQDLLMRTVLVDALDIFANTHTNSNLVKETNQKVKKETLQIFNTLSKLLLLQDDKDSNKSLSAQECSKIYDDFVKSQLNDSNYQLYLKNCKEFESKMNSKDSVDDMFNLIENKVFRGGLAIYKGLIEKYPIYKDIVNIEGNEYSLMNIFNIQLSVYAL